MMTIDKGNEVPENAKVETLKLQRPVGGNMRDAQVFIYNKDRSIELFLPMTPDFKQWFGLETKVFIQGYLDEDGALILLLNRQEDPGW